MDGAATWAEVAPTLPARAVAGFGTVDLVREDRAPRVGWRVRLSGLGEIRVEDPDGRLVGIVGPEGSLLTGGDGRPDADDSGGDDVERDDPGSEQEDDEEAAEHIRLLLAPALLGEGFTTDEWAVAEGPGEEGLRAFEVTVRGQDGALRIVVDTTHGLVREAVHLPDPSRFRWAVTAWTPDDRQDPALFALPGGGRHLRTDHGWAIGFGED